MVVSIIEEDRIRKQLKTLMEDDEKRKRGAIQVLRKDKKLARDVLDLREKNVPQNIPTVTLSVKPPAISPQSKVQMSVKKPVVKRVLKPSTTLYHMEKSLNSYASKMKAPQQLNKADANLKPAPVQVAKNTKIPLKSVASVSVKNVNKSSVALQNNANSSNVTINPSKKTNITKKSLEAKTKASVRPAPRSNTNINQTNIKDPVNSPRHTKNLLKSNNSLNRTVKALATEATALPKASPSAKSVVPKLKDRNTNLTTSKVQNLSKANIKASPILKSTATKKPLINGPGKAAISSTKVAAASPSMKPPLKRTNSLVEKKSSIGSSAKVPKKVSKLDSSMKMSNKDKPSPVSDGGLTQNLTKNLSKKALVNNPQKNVEEKSSASVETGKVRALIAKIKALNPQIDAAKSQPEISKQKSNERQTIKRTVPIASTSSASSPNEEPILKKPKSQFDLDEKEFKEIITAADKKTKKPSVDPVLYSTKGYFMGQEEVASSSSADEDSESIGLYTDSDLDSDFTIRNDELVSSTDDDDDSFAKHFVETSEMDDSNDTDYKLPPNQVEDLIIHKGTAAVRDIKKGENKFFGSDDEHSKIVEIPTKRRPKVIKQPKAYCKEELMKLTVYTTAASSYKIRKRHLALKAEDNDLHSQKSISKLHHEKTKEPKEKTKVSCSKAKALHSENPSKEFEEDDSCTLFVPIEPADNELQSKKRTLKEKKSTASLKNVRENKSKSSLSTRDKAEVNSKTIKENHDEVNNRSSYTDKYSSHFLVPKEQSELNAKADSCPTLVYCEDSDIKMIPSAAPKFNIFKSEMAFVKDRNEDSMASYPALIPNEQNGQTNSAEEAGKRRNDNLSFSSTDSDMESMFSLDVNSKYMYSLDDSISSADEEEKPEFKATVVDATECSYDTPLAGVSDICAVDKDKEIPTEDTPINFVEGYTAIRSAEIIGVTIINKEGKRISKSNHESSTDPDDSENEDPLKDSSGFSMEKINIDSDEVSESSINNGAPLSIETNEEKEPTAKETIDKTAINTASNSTKIDEINIDNNSFVEEKMEENSYSENSKLLKNSTNPFKDLISFNDIVEDNVFPSSQEDSFEQVPSSTNNNDISLEAIQKKPTSKGEKDVCVEDLVNISLRQCIMYSMNVPNASENEHHFSAYESNEETEELETHNPEIPNNDSTDSEFQQAKTFDGNLKNRAKNMKNINPESAKVDYINVHLNSLVSSRVLVLLKNPIFIYGTVRMTVIVGTVEVFGYKAGPGDSLEIFSAKGCNMIKIVNLSTENNQEYDETFIREAFEKIKHDFTDLDLRTIRRLFVSLTDAIVLFEKNTERQKMIFNFKNFMNENVFPSIKSFNSKPPFGGSEHILQCKILTQSEQAMVIPSIWREFNLNKNAKFVVAGGKGVGKSTFLRYLINRHIAALGKILLIDLDIGQPELFVPQTISYTVVRVPLSGPGFFLNKQPHKAFVVGQTNVVMCPGAYENAVKHLLRECHTNTLLKDLPWVVNTMGYNKGFSLELMAMIIELVGPTNVVQIQSHKEINNFEFDLHYESLSKVKSKFISGEITGEKRRIQPYQLHKIQSAFKQDGRYQKEWSMSSKDMRYAIILARLSAALYGEAEVITDCKPLWINFKNIKMYNAATQFHIKSELLRASEGNLVYLCHHIDDYKPIECFGIGIVRAIDYSSERLYLVPAMPFEYMNFVNCLVIGEMVLPASFYKNQGHSVKDFVPFVFETEDSNSSKAINQIFHRPSEFLLGSHKSFEA